MSNSNELDLTPVSSKQGRRWLVASQRDSDDSDGSPKPLERSSVVVPPHLLTAVPSRSVEASETTASQTTQNSLASQSSDAAAAPQPPQISIGTSKPKAILPSPSERMNRVQITSVTIPDVSLVKELCPSLKTKNTATESIDTVHSNPKKIAACLAAASEETLTNVAKENNVVLLSQTVVQPNESGVNYLAIAEAEESPQRWIRKSDRKESERVTAPEKDDSPTLPQTSNDLATSLQPLDMTPTSKLPKSTQPVSTASIAVERPSANHLNETNNDDPPSVSQLPQSQQTSSGSQLGQEGELAGVVDSVLKRATPGQPTLLLFVGSEANRHVDSTSAMVASILAKRRLGTVLLIDSNADSRELTFSSGQQNQPGLVEAVLEQAPWSPMIRKGAASGVDFMPLGKRDFSGTRFQPRLRQLVADLKQAYDYICVSAGSSDSVDARLWSDISDGCYLLVSQKNANQTLAQSAVAELQASGARLLGCVVTDTQG